MTQQSFWIFLFQNTGHEYSYELIKKESMRNPKKEKNQNNKKPKAPNNLTKDSSMSLSLHLLMTHWLTKRKSLKKSGYFSKIIGVGLMKFWNLSVLAYERYLPIPKPLQPIITNNQM
jgi:hypothetical protein